MTLISSALHVGIFEDHCLGGDIILKTGFLENSIEHSEFDYRNIAKEIGIDAMNHRLIKEAIGCDLVFIGKGELIKPSSLKAIKKSGSLVAIWYGDHRPKPEPWLMKNLGECDALFMSSAGETLKEYFQLGRHDRAAFYLNPSRPDIVDEYSEIPRSVEPPIYTAKVNPFMGEEREKVYEHLCKRGDIQIVGSPSTYIKNPLLRKLYLKVIPVEFIRGRRYIEKIIRSRFGIGVSSFQNVKYYASDRLTHYLNFGKLFLAYRFPGCEDLFQDGVHVVYYDDIKDLGEKIDFYKNNQELAEKIGAKGQEKILTEYNAKNMVKMMMEILLNGDSSMFPWIEILS